MAVGACKPDSQIAAWVKRLMIAWLPCSASSRAPSCGGKIPIPDRFSGQSFFSSSYRKLALQETLLPCLQAGATRTRLNAFVGEILHTATFPLHQVWCPQALKPEMQDVHPFTCCRELFYPLASFKGFEEPRPRFTSVCTLAKQFLFASSSWLPLSSNPQG